MKWPLATLLLLLVVRTAADELAYSRKEVIYGRTYGLALTMDVFTPRQNANGAGVIVCVSEGWYSDPANIEPNIPRYVAPLIAKGYTVFAVCHGSNPKFALPEIIEQTHRSVRFIRSKASDFGVDPGRIGITGDSAGGHLSLMMGLSGKEGDPDAPDPVDRESSRVQAVVAYFPPTDFLNWGESGKLMLGTHPTVPVQGAFDFQRLDEASNSLRLVTDPEERKEIGKTVSPIYQVGRIGAPTLLVHGDNDQLIPLQQSQLLAAKLHEAGIASDFIVMPGGGHDGELIKAHTTQAMKWFDRFLAKQSEPLE